MHYLFWARRPQTSLRMSLQNVTQDAQIEHLLNVHEQGTQERHQTNASLIFSVSSDQQDAATAQSRHLLYVII